jgi:D-glycerate 3-kinase
VPKPPLSVDKAARTCYAALDVKIPEDWRVLAANLAHAWQANAPLRVGLGGGQGIGKSTLSRVIVDASAFFGLTVVAISIDDFYLTRSERLALAREVHPLLATRGPPGTHDVALCESVLRDLGRSDAVVIPVFDKGIDDRSSDTRMGTGPADVVLLEGWCVGARAQPERSVMPAINALEAQEDPHGHWRLFVNDALESRYAKLFALLDSMIFLRVPSLGAVRRWRFEQEGERAPEQRLSALEIERFVAHYERLTLWMLQDLPPRADVLVDLDEAHRVTNVTSL